MDQAEVCLNKTKQKSNPFLIWQICKFEPNSDTFLKSKIKKNKKTTQPWHSRVENYISAF